MKHIYEHKGVHLEVEYEKPPGQIHAIHSVRVLGDNYQAVGPNLYPLMHDALIVHSRGRGGRVTAASFMATIAEELP